MPRRGCVNGNFSRAYKCVILEKINQNFTKNILKYMYVCA